MLDAAVGGISGSSNTENLWLNPSGDKLDASDKCPISFDFTVTVDFKTSYEG